VDLSDPAHHRGQVICHRGKAVEVEPLAKPGGKNLPCSFKPSLGTLVCGDRVIYRDAGRSPLIVAIEPRDNLLQRRDGFGQIKAVAANVTQLVICLAVEPEPNRFLLDQFLLSAEQQSLKPLILLNKIDLLEDFDDADDPFELRRVYQPLGYEVLPCSIHQPQRIEQLKQRLAGETSVIAGVSGVGKSALSQAILPQQEIRVGEISAYNREGRHTTRSSRLYHLPGGGDLIDTPGVRGFNPVLDNARPLADGFVEIRDAAQYCRFANCRHVNEPGCAVRKAVEEGKIDPQRHAHYLKLLSAGQESIF
jgi:ribosome biogenesis GTPase